MLTAEVADLRIMQYAFNE